MAQTATAIVLIVKRLLLRFMRISWVGWSVSMA